MWRVLGLVALAGCGLVAGCGPLERAELSRGVQTLSAVAAEARLVADGVASDRTRATYARVHSRTLAEDAAHEAEKLADASVEPGLARRRDAAVKLAQRLGDTIGELETFPGGERTGRRVNAELGDISDALERLTERLGSGP